MTSTDKRKPQRLIAFFVLFLLLFNYPLISLVNQPLLVGGIPLLYLYLFGTWGLMIVALAWAVKPFFTQNE
jgi:hypothetical protein